MAPRIISWSDSEICISPVLSSAASIVSFDSTFSDSYPSHSQMSPTEAPGLHIADLGAKHTSFPGFSEGRNTSRGRRATPNDSFVRHDEYFFEDGNVTFLVDGSLYCVHRYFFSRDSVYFSTRFAQLDIRDHEALPTIISISDVERNDFEALLSILYPKNFEAHELSYEQWKSVLHLSTRWGFSSLRQLALKSIIPPTPHDQFVLARTYSVDHWVLPALTALCERTLSLSLDEAREMSMEDVILVATVREEIRGGALRVDTADIPCHIEIAQAGKLNRPMGNDVYWDRPKNGTTGTESDPTTASAVDPNVEAEIAKTMGIASPPGDKFANSAPVLSKAEFTQAQETAPTEVVGDSKPSKDPKPALPSPSPAPAPLAAAPSPAPADAAPVPKKDPVPEKDATVTKEQTPTADPAASASSKPNGESEAPNAPDADAKASETPAQTESPLATRENGAKPDGAAIEPALLPSQNGETGGEKLTITKGDDAKPEGPVTPALRLDHIHEVNAAPAMSASSPGTLADVAPSPWLVFKNKGNTKQMRGRARKQAQRGEKDSPRPPLASGAASSSVDNSVVQEPKSVATSTAHADEEEDWTF